MDAFPVPSGLRQWHGVASRRFGECSVSALHPLSALVTREALEGFICAAQEHLPGDSTLLWLLSWWEAFFPPLSSRQLTARRAFFVPSGPDTVFGAQCSPEEQQYLVLLLR